MEPGSRVGMSGRIPLVQNPSTTNPSVGREASAGHTAMRGLSNTTLVEQAARKSLSIQEYEKAVERFRALCLTPGEDVRQLEQTAEILREAGYKQEVVHLLSEALRQPGANPHVGALWIRRVINSKLWDHRYPNGLDALRKHGEVGRRAVIEFLENVGPKRRAELVLRAVRRHGNWLRKDSRGWAVAGQALVQARCYGKAVAWMSSWRKHDLDLPTLHCLAVGLRATGRIKKANEVVELALKKPGAAEQFPIFRLWTAEDQALAGDTQSASAAFKQIDPTGWDDDGLAQYYLVRGVIRVQKSEHDPREAFAMARERVEELFRRVPIYKRDVFLRREYRRCISRMAKDAGDRSEIVLALWRSADAWWFVLPLLAVPGLQLFLPCYLYRLCSRRRGVLKKA